MFVRALLNRRCTHRFSDRHRPDLAKTHRRPYQRRAGLRRRSRLL